MPSKKPTAAEQAIAAAKKELPNAVNTALENEGFLTGRPLTERIESLIVTDIAERISRLDNTRLITKSYLDIWLDNHKIEVPKLPQYLSIAAVVISGIAFFLSIT